MLKCAEAHCRVERYDPGPSFFQPGEHMPVYDFDKEEEKVPPRFRELTHKISYALTDLMPEGAKFVCIVDIEGDEGGPDDRLVATNRGLEGMVGACIEFINEAMGGEGQAERTPGRG
jgi:hypothetical protein